ncbi:HD domain-containing protein [bacterium]|nr:HD domain-containing protein [bacterium]
MSTLHDQRAKKVYENSLSTPAVQIAFRYLISETVQQYHYHNESHTRDVMHEAVFFGIHGGLSPRELELLLVSAAWHDVGFFLSQEEHEEHSVQLFSQHFEQGELPELSSQEAELVVQMIRDTRVEISPHGAGSQQIARTELSRYLLDADLSNLGRRDFFDCFERLLAETAIPPFDFHVAALGLISRHRWNTLIAEELRLEQEMRNAQELVRRIKLFS